MQYNPKRDTKLWFRAKYFGWGWTPITWQGWLTVLLYALAIYASLRLYTHGFEKGYRPEAYETIIFVASLLIYTGIMIQISRLRGEKSGWNVGFRKHHDSHENLDSKEQNFNEQKHE